MGNKKDKEQEIWNLIYSELAEFQGKGNQIQHIELHFSPFDLPQNYDETFSSKRQSLIPKQNRSNGTGYAFEDQSVGLLAPIHQTGQSKTKVDSITSYLLEGKQVNLQAYLELSRNQEIVMPHLELLDEFDPYSISGSSAQRSKSVTRIQPLHERGAPVNTEKAEFTSFLMKPVLEHLHNTKDHSLTSLLPILDNNAQAQVFAEVSNEGSTNQIGNIQHMELLPFENSNAFDGTIPSEAVEILRFKRFFKSLIKELRADPGVTMAQISAKIGQLYNPFTGKPAGKDFFLRLLKEAQKISYRTLKQKRNAFGNPSLDSWNSDKKLIREVSQILSFSESGSDSYTQNTDSFLSEALNSLGIPISIAKL